MWQLMSKTSGSGASVVLVYVTPNDPSLSYFTEMLCTSLLIASDAEGMGRGVSSLGQN
jgi:hypothetical protein